MAKVGFDEEDPTQLPEVGTAEALLHDQEWIEELAAAEEGRDRPDGEEADLEDWKLDVNSTDGGPSSPMSEPNPFQYALEQDWLMLFRNLCHAISHKAPWAYKFQLGEEQKSAIMKKVITLFTKEFIVTADEKDKVKAILREMKSQDPLDEVQALLVSYKNNQTRIWSGEWDDYRGLRGDNFIDEASYHTFKKAVNEAVTSRVHDIQSALSDQEKLKVETREMWDHIHENFECFGGMLHIHVDCIEAINDPADLPDKAYMTVQIQHGSTVYGETELKDKLRRNEDDFHLLETPGGEGATPVALFVGADLLAQEVQLVFRLHKNKGGGGASAGCGCFGSSTIARWEVPAITLFKSIEAFNSKMRTKEYVDFFPGAHFVHLTIPNVGTENLELDVAVHMDCREDSHCSVPMAIDPTAPDPTDEQLVQEMDDRQERTNEIWSVDHHKAAMKLLELFGDLQDEEYCAFQLYCDRYLVHQEFFDVGTLAVTATRKEFDVDEDRRHACAAVARLMEMRGQLTTRTCSQMTDKALDHARELCIARLLKLEAVVGSPEDSELARVQAVFIIEKTGLCSEDLVVHLADRVKLQASVTEKKLRKLTHFLGADGKPGRGSAGAVSVLAELEHTDRSLFAKVKVLHKVVKVVYRESTMAVQFAKESGSTQVLLIALMRAQVAIDMIVPALKNTLVAVWTQLTLSTEAVNPLGGSLGVIAHLYKDTMQFVDSLATEFEEKMADCCGGLSSCFDDFLINWITLCQRKILFWVETTIEQTDLEPMDGAAYNTAAQDILQMFEEVFQFYFDCSQSGDPQMEQITIPKFCALFQEFSSHFSTYLIKKAKASGIPIDPEEDERIKLSRGRRILRKIKKTTKILEQGLSPASFATKKITGWRKRTEPAGHNEPYIPVDADTFPERLSEWLVAICTLDVFTQKIGQFWNKKVNGQLLSVTAGGGMEGEPLYDVDQVRARTATILAQTKATLGEQSEHFNAFVKQRLLDYATQYLAVANTQAVDMLQYTEALTSDLDGCLVLIGEQTDRTYSPPGASGPKRNDVQLRVLMMAIRTFYGAFEIRLMEQAKFPLLPEEKDTNLDIVTVIEDVVKRNASYYNIESVMQLDNELLELKRKMRHLIQLSSQTSKTLVSSLNDRSSTATLSRSETEVLHCILEQRKDPVAEKYWKENVRD